MHGIGIELFVETVHELNAVDRTVLSNHSLEHDFTFDMFVDKRVRIFWVHLSEWRWTIQIWGGHSQAIATCS